MDAFFRFCEEMGARVEGIIADLIDTPEGWEMVAMGADGTPTRRLDKVAEDCIVKALLSEGRYRTLISEEIGKLDLGGDRGTLFLDPVDGTYNAAHGVPFYALSIALAEGGRIEKGYVRDLAHGDVFTASRSKGAFLNRHPIRVSSVASLHQSTMSIYGKKFDPGTVLGLGQKIRRWRLLGASALELCYVGSGRTDAFIDLRRTLRVTDAAAGMLVCQEAGGSVTDLEGEELRFPNEVTIGKSLVASNGHLHSKIIEYLR